MKKYVLWSALHKNICVALNEDLSLYAQGETFWRAAHNLIEASRDVASSDSVEETDIGKRIKMFQETGINKVEIFVGLDGKRFNVRCANSSSFFNCKNAEEALARYVSKRAETSAVNTGEPSQK